MSFRIRLRFNIYEIPTLTVKICKLNYRIIDSLTLLKTQLTQLMLFESHTILSPRQKFKLRYPVKHQYSSFFKQINVTTLHTQLTFSILKINLNLPLSFFIKRSERIGLGLSILTVFTKNNLVRMASIMNYQAFALRGH